MVVAAGEAHIRQPGGLGLDGEAGGQGELRRDAEARRVRLAVVADAEIGGPDLSGRADVGIAGGLRAAEGVETLIEIVPADEAAELVPAALHRVIADVDIRIAHAAVALRAVGRGIGRDPRRKVLVLERAARLLADAGEALHEKAGGRLVDPAENLRRRSRGLIVGQLRELGRAGEIIELQTGMARRPSLAHGAREPNVAIRAR